MKKKSKLIHYAILTICIMTIRSYSQGPATCPFTVTNTTSCDTYFTYEVRESSCWGNRNTNPACWLPVATSPCTLGIPCCAMPCSGTICLPSGGTWQVPAGCCTPNMNDVVIYVWGFDAAGTGCVGNAPACSVTASGGLYTCAGAVSCSTGVLNVSGTINGGCCQTTYNVSWSSTGVLIW